MVSGIVRSLDSPLDSHTEPVLIARGFGLRKSLVNTSSEIVSSQQPLSSVLAAIKKRVTLG